MKNSLDRSILIFSPGFDECTRHDIIGAWPIISCAVFQMEFPEYFFIFEFSVEIKFHGISRILLKL